MKINAKAFALATGLVWGINWFFLTWFMIIMDGISYEMTIIGRMYRGFTVSPVGSLVALLWGFMDGFLIGLLLAWIYNKLAPRFQKKEE
ncbi:MAG: bacteriophage holin [Chloroflexi bacterium]|nr:bacteriophage holin [Chloroflexota bacterium]